MENQIHSSSSKDHSEHKSGKSNWLTGLMGKKYAPQAFFVALFIAIGGGGLWASAASTTYSLWSSNNIPKKITTDDSQSVELGLKFQSTVAGNVVGVKFYKGAQNTGTHTGTLWDLKGNKLATVTFTNETASGWQSATFPTPITIAANVPYLISYHAPNGHYSSNSNYFNFSRQHNHLVALSNGSGGGNHHSRSGNARGNNSINGNGVFSYSSSTTFPTQSKNATNYWVDVIFANKLINPVPKPGIPANLTATQAGNTVVLKWDASLSANSIKTYTILRDGSQIGTTAGIATYTDTTIQPGQTYSYQVKATDSTDATSDLSAAKSITTKSSNPTPSPTPTPSPKPSPSPTPTPTPTPSPTPPSGGGSGSWWKPTASASISWNWVIGKTPSTPFKAVNVYDIDGFDNTAATVSALHAQSIKAICYIDVGTYEPGRPDLSLIPTSDVGSAVDGWPGEKWLNIADTAGLKNFVTSRMQMCASKGFDAIEPDNIDGYTNSTGFPLTAANQITYNTFLATTAHSLGLSVGLKNDVDQSGQLVNAFDWMLDEECNTYSECDTLAPFTSANKAVFDAEYTSDGETTAKFCSADVAAKINGALFALDLNEATFQPCPAW